MKYLIIITLLFVRTEGDQLSILRKRIPPTDTEINVLMKIVLDDLKVIEMIGNHTIKDTLILVEDKTVSNYFEVLRSNIAKVKNVFAKNIHGYIKRNMAIFCELAIEELDQIPTKESYVTVPQDLVDKIKFDVDQDYCIFSFLFHYGYDVEAMEAAVYFFKTFELNKSLFVVFTLRKQIKKIVRKLYTVSENGFKIFEGEIKEMITELKSREKPEKQDMEYIKQLILNCAKLFCLPTAPRTIVSNKSLLENEVEVYQKKVLGFMMNNEVCSINFLSLTNGTASQKELVSDWDCRNTLKNYEFGHEAYKRFVMKKWKKTRDICFRQKKKVTAFRRPNTMVHSFINELHSMASLRLKIQTERSYLNVVKYKNILTDTIIYFITKEARKVLKGIKTLILDCRYKSGKYIITVDQLDMMISSLTIFKMYYDELIYIIRKKIPRSVKFSMKVTEIDQLMKNTLYNLENLKLVFVNSCMSIFCKNIIKLLDFIRFAYRGSRPNKLKFKQYYLLRPVLNLYKLYVYTLLYVD